MNRIKLQLILAAFWFVSAYLAIDALFPWEWAWRCAWLNLIIGMLALLWITRTEFGDRMFYQGPQGEEDSWWPVGILWAIPVAIFFLAIIWWLIRLLGIFDW
jgi:hypothetical protein